MSIRREIILIFGYEDWSVWRQTHDLAYLLAKENKVIFVQPSVPYERLRWRGEGWAAYLRRFWTGGLEWIADNQAVIQSPPMLPMAVSIVSRFYHQEVRRYSLHLSKTLQARALKWQLGRANLLPTVLFVYHPLDLLMVGRFGERVSCWRVYDEVSRFKGWDGSVGNLIQEVEQQHIRRVDLVFASSQAQFERRKALHPDTYYVPNAVSFEMFHRALMADLPEPKDIQSIPRPRLCYVGLMDPSVDFDLLKEVAVGHPDWSLVMIGMPRGSEVERAARSLESLPNVYMLGFKPHAEIPVYLKWCDVGLIPYRYTDDKMAAYPSKLHEYLAVGLPVVSTNVPEVRSLNGLIYLANNVAEFVSLAEEALATNSPRKAEARMAVARENSWEKRVAFISDLIGLRLKSAKS